MHYAYDTVALANGTGAAVVKSGGKSWYFLTADYAFGHDLLRVAKKFMAGNGGDFAADKLVPTDVTDFSPLLLEKERKS